MKGRDKAVELADEPWIQALMEQWSEIDFDDQDHVPSNISQLARLYQESALSAGAFQAKMFEAHKITLKRRPKNFAAYFFSVLRDLLV